VSKGAPFERYANCQMKRTCYNLIGMETDSVKARVIYNPIAGPWNVQHPVKRACALLEKRGWSVQLQQTEKPGDAAAMAREAAQAGYDTVVVAGGDGTVNEAINGLVGSQTALGVLPVGTGNLWARQVGIPPYLLANPLRIREAVDGLTSGTTRWIDVGKVNDHHFLCWAGIGLDAQVATELEPRPRHTKHLGMLPYIIAAFMIARDFQGVRTRVQLDNSIVRGRTLLIVASNIQQYAGQLHIVPQARLDDGLLDVSIFKGLGFPYALRHLLTMLSRRSLQDPRIVYRQARYIEIQTDPPIPVQVDGDPVGTTPVTLQAVPRALRVLVPPTTPLILFTSAQTKT
jgi:diacylglycerol kinase (ATP)